MSISGLPDRKQNVKKNIYVLAAVLIALPSVVVTLYTYPCQDDFHYAFYAREMMQEGHNLLYTAAAWTVRYYKTFCGCYTSSFLGFLISGIINCNIWGIRIFVFCSVILFYFVLYSFIFVFACKVMGFERKKVLPLYCILQAMFNGLIYYTWHEAFYWFITSVQYLLISSFIISGVSIFILGLCAEDRNKQIKFFSLASILGFWGSGGTLSIAAFCCSIYLLIAMWGIAEKKKYGSTCVVTGIVFGGAILNGIAPGNYIRAGGQKGIGVIFNAGKLSVRYMIERWETFAKNPIFWILLIMLCLLVFSADRKQGNYSYSMPGIFVLFLYGLVSGIIFPAILGYGYNTYRILMRGNFISDTAFYVYIFFAVFYIKGWLDRKYPNICKKIVNWDTIYIVAFVFAALLIHERNDWRQIPFVREYKEIIAGEFKEYSEFCVDIYRQIEESDKETVEVYTDFVEDITCLVNPQLYEGWYDPEKEYANQTIARFYGKQAVYVYYN